MLKLLLAQTSCSASGAMGRYFLDFAEDVNADATVLRKNNRKEGKTGQPGKTRPGIAGWISGRFAQPENSGTDIFREAVESSRLFSYDLVIAGRESKRKWSWKRQNRGLVRKSWAPVLLIPEKAVFRPLKNVLLFNNPAIVSGQPILSKFAGFWGQQYFRRPAIAETGCASNYYMRRFDETGYSFFPGLEANRLSRYIRENEIGLIAVAQANREDRSILEHLPVPVLAFNSRNMILPQPKSRNSVMFPLPETHRIKEAP